MSCKTTKANIPSLLAGELSPEDHEEMLRHLEACTQCRQEMQVLEKTWNLLDRWGIEEPAASIKTRVMATAREELEWSPLPWRAKLKKSFVFQTVLGALGFSVIIYLLFPYDRIISLCETNISNGAFLALFPSGLVYFVLGVLYGLAPISISAICFSRDVEANPLIKGLGAGFVFTAFLVPHFVVQCPEFASGLTFVMALGMIVGSLTGGTGTLWILSRVRMEVP